MVDSFAWAARVQKVLGHEGSYHEGADVVPLYALPEVAPFPGRVCLTKIRLIPMGIEFILQCTRLLFNHK
jgi:hypothetical protein